MTPVPERALSWRAVAVRRPNSGVRLSQLLTCELDMQDRVAGGRVHSLGRESRLLERVLLAFPGLDRPS